MPKPYARDDAVSRYDPAFLCTSLSAQARYPAGTGEILACSFEGRPIRDEYRIVGKADLAGVVAKSYSKGNVTAGHDKIV